MNNQTYQRRRPLRNHNPVNSGGYCYSEHKDYQSSCGGNVTNKHYPLLSKLEYLIAEDMKLRKLNPSLPLDVNFYWKDLL